MRLALPVGSVRATAGLAFGWPYAAPAIAHSKAATYATTSMWPSPAALTTPPLDGPAARLPCKIPGLVAARCLLVAPIMQR